MGPTMASWWRKGYEPFLCFWMLTLMVCQCLTASAAPTNNKFNPLSYEEMNAAIRNLGTKYPNLVKVSIAQEEFGLPSPGLCGAAKNLPCQTLIMRVTNFTTYESEKATRPELYISGELHGDERIGPHTALELARILVESSNPWVNRLLNTRFIVISPLTNSLGFDRDTREEGAVDPNRDYPIDQDPASCMQAIASRIANELFRTHMFQVAITFHAGMEAIAMEWGTKTRLKRNLHKSPDDFALMQLAGGLSTYAGGVTTTSRNYPVGRMNDLVYPVEGGSTFVCERAPAHKTNMLLLVEDWAYAGNWDPDSRRTPCNPQTFGGYSVTKTTYTDDMLRVVNILVETSDRKWPGDFGNRDHILNSHSGTGHVARNVRLALMLTDMVQPYIVLTATEVSGRTVTVKWEVGGAFEVDETYATLYHKATGQVLAHSAKAKGKTRWATGTYGNRGKWPFKAQFAACFALNGNLTAFLREPLMILAHARVDSAWGTHDDRNLVSPSSFPPQTHWVNARTNEKWSKANAGRVVVGKIWWDSAPKLVTISPPVKSRGLKNWLARKSSGRQLLRTLANNEPPSTMDDDSQMNNDDYDTGNSTDDDVPVPECSIFGENYMGEYNQHEGDDTLKGITRLPMSALVMLSAIGALIVTFGGVHLYRTRASATHSRLPTEPPDS